MAPQTSIPVAANVARDDCNSHVVYSADTTDHFQLEEEDWRLTRSDDVSLSHLYLLDTRDSKICYWLTTAAVPFGVYDIVQVCYARLSLQTPPIVHLEFQHPPPDTAASILRPFAGQLVPDPSLEQVGDGSHALYQSWLTITVKGKNEQLSFWYLVLRSFLEVSKRCWFWHSM